MPDTSPPVLVPPMADAVHPPHLAPGYRSTLARAPRQRLVPRVETLAELTAPVYGADRIKPLDHDLTRNGVRDGAPQGERIIVTGRVTDETGRPVRRALVEVWQANAAGRYIHKLDQHDAPIDPNFTGAGRILTDDDGRYRFVSIRPGAYPWRNQPNAWRPPHIHLSLFGDTFPSRLVTQMYFPGDPLLKLDPIYNSIPDEDIRRRLISHYDHAVTEPGYALGYRFDIVLCGGRMTPIENLKF